MPEEERKWSLREMTPMEQEAAAKKFSESWKGKGYEKGQSQPFWLSLLHDVYGVDHPEEYISFENQVLIDNTSFIDGMISNTHVLIEQKSINRDLYKAIRQSDGTYLTPLKQAKRYISELPKSQHPDWVITCNFKSFLIYNMEEPNGAPDEIRLENFASDFHYMRFLVDPENKRTHRESDLSVRAGEIVGEIYDAFAGEYIDITNERSLHSLNVLCVRLVFCLYAENSCLFGPYGMFYDYLAPFKTSEMRDALIKLFEVLDTPEDARDPYLRRTNSRLAAFPYVNGGLFSDATIEIPAFTEKIRELLLERASAGFNWAGISPTIFGAVFESTLNPETRRSGGMHYTSIENIHKVIDPLFLDGLEGEFEKILEANLSDTKRTERLNDFQDKLASLTFLDPACGSGNFLTETYLSLRKLENRILESRVQKKSVHGRMSGQIYLGGEGFTPIKVSLIQFYGIEINDFAVTVAKTALWIAESQMMKETQSLVSQRLDFLPLKTNVNIVEGNALRMDWETVVSKDRLSYIMGNPPFVGYFLQTEEQKDDIRSVYVDENGKTYKTAGKIDYVAGWYFKAAELMRGTEIRTALVSTNSVTQGEQVAGIWKPLYDRFGLHIDFAHRTFRWDSEASLMAHVHCVIIGFSLCANSGPRLIYDADGAHAAANINPYLTDAPDIIVESRDKPICDVPQMVYGNKPADGGHLFLTADEYEDAIRREPGIAGYVRQIYGATEYINNVRRYCLWLVDASPADVRRSPFIKSRVEKVRQFRLGSKKEATKKSAETPTLFQEIRQPSSEYVIVPRVSSERRQYVPFGFVGPEIIVNDAVQIIPNASLYHFGVLTSSVHMAWMRAVCGRLEMRYRYSKDIVYDNFPWPNPSDEQKARIEQTAKAILDARELYPECSLADLYDDLSMPQDLRQAHKENDKAVMAAYGWRPGDEPFENETACVAELMKLYQSLTEG